MLRAHDGFALLEALLGLTIVAGLALAALGYAGQELRTATREREIIHAAVLAEERMTELTLVAAGVGSAATAGSAVEGNFDPPFGAYRWRSRTVDAPVAGMRDISIRIEWPGGTLEHVRRVSTGR